MARSSAKLKVLVIGDIILDEYIQGASGRVTPDTGVPVVLKQTAKKYAGGAANVAMNLQSLGVCTTLIGMIGNDPEGHWLMDHLSSSGIILKLHVSSFRPTTHKQRILSEGRPVVRLDQEEDTPALPSEKRSLAKDFLSVISGQDMVLLQDYDKGTLHTDLIHEVISTCNTMRIPVAADPKYRNFHSYHDLTFYKPNLDEFLKGVGLSDNPWLVLAKAGKQWIEERSIKSLTITLGSAGILFVSEGNYKVSPAMECAISDTSGAGDTVFSLLAVGYLLNVVTDISLKLANLGGGIACQYSGTYVVSWKDLREQWR